MRANSRRSRPGCLGLLHSFTVATLIALALNFTPVAADVFRLPNCNTTLTINGTCTAAVCGDGFLFNVTGLTTNTSLLSQNEECDDGNTVSGDGCSSGCTVESKYVCMAIGEPCVRSDKCPSNKPTDCRGVCGGTAIVDSCGKCTGYGTGKVPGYLEDVCGVCYGDDLVATDDCGVCFGGNKDKDACGVCWGDNSTCTGCDGIVNSGNEWDGWGMCATNPAPRPDTCNGLPISEGGYNYDACGVCGGDHEAGECFIGCDAVLDSGVYLDCNGDCGGSAVIDDCGVCTNGSTSVAYNAHYNETTGTCFVPAGSCPGTVDACGVCGGDNSTCTGCDGVPGSGVYVDPCGECGGTHTQCHYSCDGILDGSLSYDCDRQCGGSMVVDPCGACVSFSGPNSAYLDLCGKCFGNGECDCGVNNTGIDSCGVCLGGNADKDLCGQCFLNNQAQDECGVCWGDGSSCAGCDNIPNSGMVVDSCGVCGGDGTSCKSPNVKEDKRPRGVSLVTVLGVSGGGLVAIVTAAVCLVVYYQRHKKNFVVAYQEQRARALEDAPRDQVTLVFTDIQDSTVMWETFPESMPEAIDIHHNLCRGLIDKYHGYEVKTEGDAFMIAFGSPLNAVKWTMEAQMKFLRHDLPPDIMQFENCQEQVGPSGTLLWRGLRVRMGVHVGFPSCKEDKKTKIMDYFGPMVNRAARVEGAAHGGQVLITEAVYEIVQDYLNDPKAGLDVQDLGSYQFKGLRELIHVYQVLPQELCEREFPEVKSFKADGEAGGGTNLYCTIDFVDWDPSEYAEVLDNHFEDPDDPETYGVDDCNSVLEALPPPVRPSFVPHLDYLPRRNVK